MRSQKTAVVLFLVLGLSVSISFQAFGPAAWKLWNIPTLQPSFADARIITASAESFQLGFDPEVENPRDPFGRLFNLPMLWKFLFLTSIDQRDTYLFVGFLITSFFVGLLIFLLRVEVRYSWLTTLFAFSPPVMLAIERGNVDLHLFFLCAISLSLIEKPGIYPSAVLLLAGGLKLFPIFGVGALMKYDRSTFLKFSTGIALIFLLILVIDIPNLRNAFANTEDGFDISYGIGVLPFYVSHSTGSTLVEQIAILISVLAVLAGLIFCLIRATRKENNVSVSNNSTLAAFRLGAGIYVGTFLLGNNWDYRLMFLLFTLPQLLEWASDHGIARYTLAAILLSFSYLWVTMILPFAYFMDEIANWMAWGGLLYLLVASSPDWFRLEIRGVVDRRRRKVSSHG